MLLPPQEVRPGRGGAAGLPANLRLLVGHGSDDFGQAHRPFIEQASNLLRQLALVSARVHAPTIPRVAGHCSANWLRSRMIACDFNCEMRDSCRLTTWAISRSVNSS